MKLMWLLLITLTAWSQEPAFDVASIKPSQSARDGSGISNSPGRFSTENTTLAQLIQYCLPAQDYQVVGGPGWIQDARFDIVASTAQTDADLKNSPERIARIRARLLHLLEDRFQLQLREEQREMGVYDLSVEKSGVRMKAAEPSGNVMMNGNSGRSTMSGKGMTMQRLADILSGVARRPVIDTTGLSGAYDVELKYSTALATPDSDAASSDFPSLFTALKEQLGLRLTGTTGAGRVWVVVRAEKPTEN
ncbi:MAG TPA: TIGR03435 family protein [Bryobacteraceae bacterium]|nr:TIGR03435 family protein [Bryobacteraceae bacterium]